MRSLTVLLCFLAFGAHAEVYKWTDASGRVQFSDQPPPASQGKAQRMNLNESRVTTVAAQRPASAAVSASAAQASAVQNRTASPTSKPPKDEKACAAAESRLTFLKSANMFKQISNDQGKVEFLPTKQREQEIVERSAFIEKNCR